jgi:TonB family protein
MMHPDFNALRARAARRRRTAFRLAATIGMAVVACLVLLGGLGELFSGLQADQEAVAAATLDVLDVPPPPPPPPAAPQAPTPPSERPPEIPDLPPMDLSFLPSPHALALPRMRLDADPLRLPGAVPSIRATSAEASTDGSILRGSSPPRRLIVPDLQRFYPRRLIDQGIEGRTRVRVFVSASGKVERVEVLSSVPPNRFEDAARRAMATVRYEPATDEAGRPVPGVVNETLQWRNKK